MINIKNYRLKQSLHVNNRSLGYVYGTDRSTHEPDDRQRVLVVFNTKPTLVQCGVWLVTCYIKLCCFREVVFLSAKKGFVFGRVGSSFRPSVSRITYKVMHGFACHFCQRRVTGQGTTVHHFWGWAEVYGLWLTVQVFIICIDIQVGSKGVIYSCHVISSKHETNVGLIKPTLVQCLVFAGLSGCRNF